MSGPIYPAAVMVKPPSGIRTWSGWPEDVHDTLWAWNHGKEKSRLSFTNGGIFKCVDCEHFCQPQGWCGAVLDGDLICDDCLIDRARQPTDPNCAEPMASGAAGENSQGERKRAKDTP